MKLRTLTLAALIAASLSSFSARADTRRFTYVYEPETLPAGAVELENWITLRTQRNETVGEDNYNRWDLRQEIEFGITDRYSLALYLNEKSESFRDPGTSEHVSDFDFDGVSIENRYNLLNPADHAIGLTLYLEGRYSGSEAELEEKIIIGQRHGNWKWAFNLEHATEWEDDLSEREGELGASFGIARDLGNNWSLGLEVRNQTILPDYHEVENTALYAGPVLSYHRERWWAALSVLPQIKGWNLGGDPDGDSHYELVDNEKLNIRLLFGITF